MHRGAATQAQGLLARLIAAAAPALALALAFPTRADAAKWLWDKAEKRFSYSLQFSGREMMPFGPNPDTAPPRTTLAEAEFTLWYRGMVGAYAQYGTAARGAATNTLGGGLKLPFISLGGSGSGPAASFTWLLVAEMVRYWTVDPAIPGSYDPSSWVFRSGFSLNWGLGTGLYLDTSAMLADMAGMFYVTPRVGVGFHF